MGVIAALLPTSGHLQRLRTAIRDRHQVVPCDDWGTLLSVCERQPVRVAVIDLFAGGRSNFERIRHLRQRLPRLTLIAYVAYSADRAHDLFDAGRQGMDGLVLADQDDAPRALLALVEHAESRSLGASSVYEDALSGPHSRAASAREWAERLNRSEEPCVCRVTSLDLETQGPSALLARLRQRELA